jgi:hypothetical protein
MAAVGKYVQFGVPGGHLHAHGTGRGEFVVLAGGDQDRHLEFGHFRETVPVLEIADRQTPC